MDTWGEKVRNAGFTDIAFQVTLLTEHQVKADDFAGLHTPYPEGIYLCRSQGILPISDNGIYGYSDVTSRRRVSWFAN